MQPTIDSVSEYYGLFYIYIYNIFFKDSFLIYVQDICQVIYRCSVEPGKSFIFVKTEFVLRHIYDMERNDAQDGREIGYRGSKRRGRRKLG